MLFSTILPILFLAVSGVNADMTICEQVADTNGYCNVYTDEGEYVYGKRTECRKASACNVQWNGCWLNAEKINGQWYSNCS
ncbi:hypothetical protein Vi05172_g11720 [Venturia inaequalis]|nr:hypothetical protein Vi05172_g11720 [Venturia inaequalis]